MQGYPPETSPAVNNGTLTSLSSGRLTPKPRRTPLQLDKRALLSALVFQNST